MKPRDYTRLAQIINIKSLIKSKFNFKRGVFHK